MSAAPTGSTPSEREIQIAIAPLETLLNEDLGEAAASVDHWLREITYGLVNLQQLRQAAESVPVVCNALAGVDVLIDILTLVENPSSDPLDWVSLGINLIGVIPVPPGVSGARKVLRPVLQLTRQTLRRRPDANIGAVILEILDGHLHANIRGTLEHYVREALVRLPAMLSAAADTARLLFTTLARTLEAAARGQLDAEASHQLSRAQMAEVALYDSALNTDMWRLALSALANASEGNLKDAYNSVARHFGEALEGLLRPLVRTLDDLASSVPDRLEALGAPGLENSIGWLLSRLLNTVLAHPFNRSVTTNIRPGVTSQARYTYSEGPTEVVSRQVKARKAPNPKKNGPCPCTAHSIGHALGNETVAHQDFVLPGPFPVDWTRVYNSRLDALDSGCMGARWITEFTTCIDLIDQSLVLHDSDGRSHDFPLPKVGAYHYDPIEYLTLVRTSAQQLVLLRGVDRRET